MGALQQPRFCLSREAPLWVSEYERTQIEALSGGQRQSFLVVWFKSSLMSPPLALTPRHSMKADLSC